MNAKNIIRNMRGLAMSALLLIPAAFVSCSDDDTEGGSPYFRLENTVVSSKLVTASSDLGFDAEAIIGDATLELIRYDIRSNCNWSVECNSTDGDWIKFYPKTGQGDGKVRFCLEDNDANTWPGCEEDFKSRDASLDLLAETFHIRSRDPFQRVKELQTGFDPSVLNFSDAYYDTLGLEKPKRGMQRKEKPLFEFPPITFDLYQEDDP